MTGRTVGAPLPQPPNEHGKAPPLLITGTSSPPACPTVCPLPSSAVHLGHVQRTFDTP